ncbi:MAG: hypothetical protein JRJ85_14405 [Deltaproteobacteria bacterium]|nr:hypothetical protein [Deltaproteobacteria bacterium]
MLKLWKFSGSYLDVASFHDSLENAETLSKELMIVHFSNLLVKSMGFHLGTEETIDLEEAPSRQFLKLTDEMIGEARDRVERLMDETKTIFS